jgi:hypothetical protein
MGQGKRDDQLNDSNAFAMLAIFGIIIIGMIYFIIHILSKI